MLNKKVSRIVVLLLCNFPYDLSLKKKLAIKWHSIFTFVCFIEVPDKENQTNDSEVILRRTQSFENDEKWV